MKHFILYITISLIVQKITVCQKLPEQFIITVNRSEHNVSIVDAKSYKIIKQIPVGIGPHEVALSPNNKFAIVLNYGEYPVPHKDAIRSSDLKWIKKSTNSLTKIDLVKMETVATFALEDCSTPHHGVISADSKTMWCTCEEEKKVIEIDTDSGLTLRSWQTDQIQTHFLAKNEDKILTTNIGSNSVSFIDLNTNQVRNLSVGNKPEGVGISPDNEEAWVLCFGDNAIYILDIEKEEVKEVIDSGTDFPIEIQWRPESEEVWVSNVTSKEISIYSTKSKKLIDRIPLPSTALGLLLSPDGSRAFVSLPRLNLVKVIDTNSRKIVDEFAAGMETDGIIWGFKNI